LTVIVYLLRKLIYVEVLRQFLNFNTGVEIEVGREGPTRRDLVRSTLSRQI